MVYDSSRPWIIQSASIIKHEFSFDSFVYHHKDELTLVCQTLILNCLMYMFDLLFHNNLLLLVPHSVSVDNDLLGVDLVGSFERLHGFTENLL